MEGAGSIGMTKMAENMGISTDQLRGMMKLETAVQEQKETLLATAKTQTEKDAINAMGTQDILDSMSKEEQKALEDANKSELDMAKKQSGLTSTMLDKLGVLVDFIMNQIYNIMVDIWDLVASIPGIGKGKEFIDTKRAALEASKGSPELAKAFNKALKVADSGDASLKDSLKKELIGGSIGKQLEKALADPKKNAAMVNAIEKMPIVGT